jgi:hypothetical protein
MDWRLFLTSGVVAALVAGFVSRRNSERMIQTEHITRERAKWRDKIRCIARQVREAATEPDLSKLEGLRLDLSLNLNPLDKEDQEILSVICEISKSDRSAPNVQEFFDRLGLLLKHDWDRAKHEAKPWPFLRPAPRHTYKELKRRRALLRSNR